MRTTVVPLLLVALWCCGVLGQEDDDDTDISRLNQKRVGRYDYQAELPDVSNHRKHSISTVTVQLKLKDKPVTSEPEDDYVTAPAEEFENYPKKNPSVKRTIPPGAGAKDTETGASDNQSAARYLLPPDGFLESMRLSHSRYVPNVATSNNFNNYQFSTQSSQQSFNSTPHQYLTLNNNQQYQQIQQNRQQQNQQQQKQQEQSNSENSASASQVHYVSTPAPPHFTSPANQRNQYVPQLNFVQGQPSNQVQYISPPASMNFGQSIDNNQYSSQPQAYRLFAPPPQRMQFVATPSPTPQFQDQGQQSQYNFVSTPAPNLQYLSTPSPHDHYGSTPVSFISTPSPMQFATGSSIFGNRIASYSQLSGDKNMHIDHFDNAMSGVRNPKYQQQSSNNFYTTSTAAPMVVSTTASPASVPSKPNVGWRNQNTVQQYAQDFQPTFSSVNIQTPQNIQFSSGSSSNNNNNNNNFHDQPVNLNAMESASYLVNVVHPNTQIKGQHRFQMNRVNQQRDVEKDTEIPSAFSAEQFGWKLTPKKTVTVTQTPINENGRANSLVVTSFSANDNRQTVTLQPTEFKPYPDNPFLNHITISAPESSGKTGSIQNIQFQPDSGEEQNVNVGYSIGFGNSLNSQDLLKPEPTVYANKYPFLNSIQSFTTASPSNFQNEVVKGVQLSSIELPDQPYFYKESPNPQDYVSNAIKINEKYKFGNGLQYGSGTNAINSYSSLPATSYKITQSLKPIETHQTNIFPAQLFSRSSNKGLSFQSNSPSIVTAYQNGDPKSYKWPNVSPNLEVSGGHVSSLKPVMVEVSESVTPNPVLYLNNPNDVVTSSPYFLASKDSNGGKILQNFDHASALKNIQPIGISNVIPYSQKTSLDSGSSMSITHFGQNLQQYHPTPQLNSIQNGQLVQFPQDQPIAAASVRPQNPMEGYYGVKPIDQGLYNEKNIFYNVQSLSPIKSNSFDGSGYNEVRAPTYFFNQPREQQAYDSTMQTMMVGAPLDMVGYSSNVNPRHAPSVDNTQSESIKSRDLKGDKTSSVRVTYMQPDGKLTTNYHHIIAHDSPSDLQGQYSNEKASISRFESEVYDSRMNQNMNAHQLEPMPSGSETSYRVTTNKRHNGEEVVYEHPNDINPKLGGKLTTIDGIQVANPYNVDMKAVSDMLKGKPAVDESKLEPIREQMSKIKPLKLDTSALQEAVTKSERISVQIDIPKSDKEENNKKRHFDEPRNTYKKKHKLEYTAPPRAYKDYENQKHQHSVPHIASEQLQSTIQTVLNGHQIGAVVEQPGSRLKNKNRDSESYETQEQYQSYEESDFETEQSAKKSILHPNSLEEETLKRPLMQDIEEPYPLLKPPPPPISLRGNNHHHHYHHHQHKKSDKRPYGARHNRHLGHRHTRPKLLHDAEDLEDYDIKISSGLRPPPPMSSRKKSSG